MPDPGVEQKARLCEVVSGRGIGRGALQLTPKIVRRKRLKG
jgi:hypothetical protein